MRMTFDEIGFEMCGPIGYVPPDPNWSIGAHSHETFELHFVMEGYGVNYVNDGELEFAPNIVYLAPPGEVHSQQTDRRTPMGLHYVSFKLSMPGLHKPSDRVYCRLPHVKTTIDNIVQLGRSGTGGGQVRAGLKMAELIWDIVETTVLTNDRKAYNRMLRQTGDDNCAIDQAIRFIHERLADNPGIEQISRACYLSRRHLSRLFVKNVGMSVQAFVDRERFLHACLHLRESDDSVSELSRRMNFSTSQYFGQWFKSHAMVTPTEYRAKHRTNS